MTELTLVKENTSEFKTAKKLLEHIRGSNDYWLPKYSLSSPWIFRGENNDDWKLLPSAWRDEPPEIKQILDIFKKKRRLEVEETLNNTKIDISQKLFRDKVRDAILQVASELDVIHSFIDLADEIGLRIPIDETTLTKTEDFIKCLTSSDKVNKDGNLESFIKGGAGYDYINHSVALAQHHGMPTRLLDWTRNSLIAAFFAADGALDHNEKPKKIAIWAIRKDVFSNLPVSPLDTNYLKIKTCPRSEFQYLHAQDGVFTYYSKSNRDFIRNGSWPQLDDIIANTFNSFEEFPLRKMILPSEQAPELLRLLNAEGISRAHLMPIYDNVTKTLKSLWRRVEMF